MTMTNDQQFGDGVSVHYGFPNPAADKTLESLDLHQLLVQRPISTFLFRITGADWQDLGIFDGDIAVVDRALSPRKTDIAAWWDNDRGEFRLSYYRDLPADGQVFGVITSTVHQFRK